ncbi:MAG: ankyrin repeat domain-containing protein [Steroidobacter sp.]
MNSISLLLFALVGTANAATTGYFVKLESDSGNRINISVQLGEHLLGPRPVSKNGGTTYGPVPWAIPVTATVTWQMINGQEQSAIISLRDYIPNEFKVNDALIFRIGKDGTLAAFFAYHIDEFRSVEIPVNESPADADQRRLNEGLLKAAGSGQLDQVRALVLKGANPNYLFGSIYPSPVRYAANGGHFVVVDFLLEAGAKVSKRDLMVPYLAEKAAAMNIQPQ